jgi:Flp pilus assembly protein TadB
MNNGLAKFGAVAVCAACCMPLILPLLWGAAAAVACGTVALALLTAAVLWMLRRGHTTAVTGACASSCNVETCAPARQALNNNDHAAVQR